MVKLNIHFAVDEQTAQFCRQVNANIRHITNSTIVFSGKSRMIPHITLVMGDFVPSQTFDALTTVTKALAQGVKPLTLKLGQPYIEPLRGRFVLCDIQEDSALTELRTMMRENILGTFLTTPFPHPRAPHLTLAHIYTRQAKVYSYLKLINEMPQPVCSHIEISHVGPMGACVNRLFALNLAHEDNHRVHSGRHQSSFVGMPGFISMPG